MAILLFRRNDFFFRRVVAVAGGAVVRHAALRAVAFDARLFRRQQYVRSVAAVFHFVASFAFHLEMFGVIERGANHPAVGNLRRCDVRRAAGRLGDLMAIGAAGKTRRALRIESGHDGNGSHFRVAGKNPTLQRLARTELGPDPRVIRLREFHEIGRASCRERV